MTQDDIIKMAEQSGMELYGLGQVRVQFLDRLEAFAKLAATKAIDDYLAGERESELRARGEA